MALRKTLFTASAILGLMALAAPGMAFMGLFDSHKKVAAGDGAVRIPLAEVSDGKAHFYSFGDKGRDIRFFVLKSGDGAPRAAFDACDVCFPARKGYSQDGDFMVCNNCGMRFYSARISEVQGGCNPAPLARAVEGKDLVIRAADLAAGSRFF